MNNVTLVTDHGDVDLGSFRNAAVPSPGDTLLLDERLASGSHVSQEYRVTEVTWRFHIYRGLNTTTTSVTAFVYLEEV